MSETSSIETSVVVVGGGPIGLTAFVGLLRAGVDAVLVEKHPSTAFVPKALLLNERTMEVYRQLGLEDDIRAVGLSRDEVGFIFHGETLDAEVHERFPMLNAEAKSAVASCLCSQDALEPVLRAHAERLAPGCLLFGTRVDGLTQDADGVELELVDVASGARRTARSRYVVGADGTHSTVRELVGVATTGEPVLGHSVHVVFDAPLGERLAERVSAMSYATVEVGGGVARGLVFVVVDGDRRWRLMFNYDPEVTQEFSPERCVELIRAGAGIDDLEVEIRGIFPWEPAALLAERFRVDRVLLAGDAAHVRPPWGGLGMNAGIGDAHNLVWKLAAVLDGQAADGLLDTYEIERRPIAERTIAAAIHNGGGGARVSGADPVSRAQAARRRHAEGLVLGFTYASPAVLPDATSPPVVEDEHADYVPAGRPGHRAPHVWLDRGETASITDHFGAGFVLLTGPAGTAWKAAAEEPSAVAAAPLRALVLGGPEGDLTDPHGGWAALYCPSPDGAVLVRPDGVVAWRSATLPPAPLTELRTALETVLGHPRAQRAALVGAR